MTDRLLAFLRVAEGLRLSPYQDIAGLWTIGYGHRCSEDEPSWTHEQAESQLETDIASAQADALRLSPVLHSEPARLDAITDFIFNLGESAYSGSHLHRFVDNELWENAATEIVKWDHTHVDGKPVVVDALLRRRIWEAGLLRTGGA